MIDQWRELKETITELRDNDGTATQQEVCKFLENYMGVLEKQMIDPIDRVLEIIDEISDSTCITFGTMTYSDGKGELKNRVFALKEGEQE